MKNTLSQIPHKTCSKCKEVKSAEEFHKDKSKNDGLTSYCKSCTREQKRKWREANPEKHREQKRKWYAANPEKHREYARKWREAHPEKAREHVRKWRETNPEKAREYGRKWREANLEKAREYGRKWYEANLEKDRERSRKWREANPDKIYAYKQEELAKRSSRVARIRKMMAHFAGRIGWLENLAAAIATRSDAQGLSWIASDIDELLLIHYYKEV